MRQVGEVPVGDELQQKVSHQMEDGKDDKGDAEPVEKEPQGVLRISSDQALAEPQGKKAKDDDQGGSKGFPGATGGPGAGRS